MEKVIFHTSIATLLIPVKALSTYRSKHNAVNRMKELGGIHAVYTDEVRRLMNRIRNANRKIDLIYIL